GYSEPDNVYLSREVVRWTRELVGTVCLDRFEGANHLGAEIAGKLFQAVVGTSRLPLTSLEAPLPAFSLGQLGYFPLLGHGTPEARGDPCLRSWPELVAHRLSRGVSWLGMAKLLEFVLRAIQDEEVPDAATLVLARWRQVLGYEASDLLKLLRTLFYHVSL